VAAWRKSAWHQWRRAAALKAIEAGKWRQRRRNQRRNQIGVVAKKQRK
jgi:hypothetical protein